METNPRPAYYALPSGAWRDYVTVLHLPYTAWHLGYVLLGAAAAPVVFPGRVAGVTLAFFLAVGVAAHALDEYRGRPLRTHIPDGTLLAVATASLAGSIAIGVAAALTISLWATPFVVLGVFLVPAYNLELFRSRFHSDLWFAIGWGAFPALVGYWANAERLDLAALMVAGGCFALSLAQRTLSNRVRRLRRNALSATGRIVLTDGEVEAVDLDYLVAAPETALRLMGLSVVFLALGMLISRL